MKRRIPALCIVHSALSILPAFAHGDAAPVLAFADEAVSLRVAGRRVPWRRRCPS